MLLIPFTASAELLLELTRKKAKRAGTIDGKGVAEGASVLEVVLA